jgi:hypothetical protein
MVLAALLAFAPDALAVSVDWRVEWPRTDFARHTVDLSEIRSGGPPKDGIPAIDAPQFKLVSEVSDLAAMEPVITLRIQSDARRLPPADPHVA